MSAAATPPLEPAAQGSDAGPSPATLPPRGELVTEPGKDTGVAQVPDGTTRTAAEGQASSGLQPPAATGAPTAKSKPTKKAGRPAGSAKTAKSSTSKPKKVAGATQPEAGAGDAGDAGKEKKKKNKAKPAAGAVPKDEEKDKPETSRDPTEALVPATPQALDEQHLNSRMAGMRRFKNALTRGAVSIAGSALPSADLTDGMDIEASHSGAEVSSDEESGSASPDEHEDEDSQSDSNSLDGDVEDDDKNDLQVGESGNSHTVATNHATLDSIGHVALNTAGNAALGGATGGGMRNRAKASPAAGQDKKDEKQKVTYKVTARQLDDLDEKADRATASTLKARWANITFYIIASLVIVLPLLFLVLGIFLFVMEQKPAEPPSHWFMMQQAIKVAASAWPIVFAAVAAQLLKTWATYKVERGIKLMELEQLVGSTSFAAAIKQPLLVRSPNLLALLLFVIWCLSPIGSSALQRIYSIDYRIENRTSTVKYLDMTSQHRTLGTVMLENGLGEIITRKISPLYLDIFTPSLTYSEHQDIYFHPKPIWLDGGISGAPPATSDCGVPVLLEKPPVGFDASGDSSANGKWENVDFSMTTSYFEFQCGPWSVVKGSSLNKLDSDGKPLFSASASDTTRFYFYWSDGTSGTSSLNSSSPAGIFPSNSSSSSSTSSSLPSSSASAAPSSGPTSGALKPRDSSDHFNKMTFASVIRNGTYGTEISILPQQGSDPHSLHSLIDCDLRQVYIDMDVRCERSALSSSGAATCQYRDTGGVRREDSNRLAGKGALLLKSNVQDSFAYYTSPMNATVGDTTLNELFLGRYQESDPYANRLDTFNLSQLVTPAVFERRMAYLFNTFVDFGNAADYVTYNDQANVTDYNTDYFVTVTNATHTYTGDLVYYTDRAWVAIYLVCAVLMLVGGVVSVIIESLTVVPDVLGYVSTVARNSRYLTLPKTKLNSTMSGGERAKKIGSTVVMMQDVKGDAEVGKIALGNKKEQARKLQRGRMYR